VYSFSARGKVNPFQKRPDHVHEAWMIARPAPCVLALPTMGSDITPS